MLCYFITGYSNVMLQKENVKYMVKNTYTQLHKAK